MSRKPKSKPRRIVGDLLRSLREEAGLPQREIGARLGKPQSWVYNCEQGQRKVVVEEFVNWARACGVDPKVAFARAVEAL